LSLLLVIEKPGERVEALLPELAGLVEPVGSLLHRFRGQGAADHSALLFAPDQPRVLQDCEVLHEPWKRHREGARELGDRAAAGGERGHDLPARRVGERGENRVEGLVHILNH